MTENIPVRLRWSGGRVETMPDGVDPEMTIPKLRSRPFQGSSAAARRRRARSHPTRSVPSASG